MSRPRPPVDRLLYFTDAIVAIAATLLVLPLVDEAGTFFTAHPPPPTTEFISEHTAGLLAFAISFVVIVRLWAVHHRLFASVIAADGLLVTLDLLWAATIVFLPLPTEITASSGNDDRAAIALYVGTMLASSLVMLAVVVHLRRTADLATERPSLSAITAVTLLFAVALVVGVLLASYLPLLLLLLSGVLGQLLEGRLDSRGAERS
ncbi:MAG TPA: TMEM175 family protein [Candidatus Nanopelagicales bacterium]|nr:TMEM175 family protein [Candidatus Nanopelagicales bacterium]